MVRKGEIHLLAKVLLPVTAFGGVYVVYSGAVVPSPGVPSGDTAVLVLAFVAAGVAYAVAAALATRSWKRAGSEAGLSADGLGLGIIGDPTLSGTRRGRTVRARTTKRTTGASAADRSQEETFTIVEADLDRPAEAGAVVGPRDLDFTDEDRAYRHETDGMAAVSDASAAPEALLSGEAAAALSGIDLDDQVYAGDAAGLVPDSGGGTLATMARGLAKGQIPGDGGTVSHEAKGLERDGESLDRRIEAVVAAAEAFETATER
jgi:hypothetical protein